MTQMQDASALGRVVELVRDLRRRCPWDAAQTPDTLRPYLVEEALELDHALAGGNAEAVRVELGDLLLHVAFQIVLAEERGAFGAEDVTRAVEQKMWRRHPHLFPETADAAPPSGGHTWEELKRTGEPDPTASVLDGLPPTLPALIMAYRLQERAAGVGFDWSDAAGPRAKVDEELGELDRRLAQAASPPDTGRSPEIAQPRPASREVEEEIGDVLFAVVNLARKLGVDARAALERANAKFARRFRALERLARVRNLAIAQSPLETLDDLWNEVKRSETEAP